MQREMQFFVEARSPQLAPDELVKACRHRLDAIRLSVQLSGLSCETVAGEIGMDKGNFSRVMSGRASPPADDRGTRLLELCGFAPLQWEANRFGFLLVADSKAQRRAELLRELENLAA